MCLPAAIKTKTAAGENTRGQAEAHRGQLPCFSETASVLAERGPVEGQVERT